MSNRHTPLEVRSAGVAHETSNALGPCSVVTSLHNLRAVFTGEQRRVCIVHTAGSVTEACLVSVFGNTGGPLPTADVARNSDRGHRTGDVASGGGKLSSRK